MHTLRCRLLPPSRSLLLTAALCLCAATGVAAAPSAADRVPVVFSGGHDTDQRDGDRPVVLIAAALGVPPEVFREAFSHVHPAPAGQQPDPQEVRDNKRALLSALAPYGVTNERLDTVSNYYRYVRSRGERWPATPAVAYAVRKNGLITSYVVTSGGSGYSSAPTVTVPGVPDASAKAELSFSTTFEANGSVSTISVGPKKAK